MIGSRAAPHRGHARREQGWELSISSTGVSFRRYCCFPADAPETMWTQTVRRTREGSFRRRRWWLVPLIAGCGSIAAGVLAAPAMIGSHGYSVVVPVPDSPRLAASDAPLHPPASRFVSAKPRHRLELSLDDLIGDAATGSMAPANDAADSVGSDAAEQRFTDVAMRTGAMQAWRSSGVRYFLVAGDLQAADGKACRQFSLLARPDAGEDSVRQFERCRTID